MMDRSTDIFLKKYNFSFRYGDRYPRSSLGRVFAIIWFLIGMIINSLLVSAVTSTCSRQVLKEILQAAEPGKVVGVLKGSPGIILLALRRDMVHQVSTSLPVHVALYQSALGLPREPRASKVSFKCHSFRFFCV